MFSASKMPVMLRLFSVEWVFRNEAATATCISGFLSGISTEEREPLHAC